MGDPARAVPTATPRRVGARARLLDVACSAGRRDVPYPEEHASWSIALVRRGAFNYRAADTNRVHALRPGWLLLCRAGHTFECSHDHDGGDDCAALLVPASLVEEVARHTPGCRGAIFPAPVAAPITRVAALVERLATGAVDVDEAACDIASAVLADVHGAGPSRGAREDAPPSPAQRARVDAAIAAIEARAHEPLSLAELAACADMSPFHFLRVFRKTTGITPHQYLVGARLRLAARLLVDTTRSVTDIAYDAGFEDLSHFVRTFRRTVGASPRAFRTSGSRITRARR